MAKKVKTKSKGKAAEANAAPPTETAPLVIGDEKAAFDPTLASLFANSAGPVKAPEIVVSRRSLQDEEAPNGTKESSKSQRKAGSTKPVDQDTEQDDELADSDAEMQDVNEGSEDGHDARPATTEKTRKRKRGAAEDTLEDSYMKKLAKEEEKEQKKRTEEKKAKRQKKGDDSENEQPNPDSGLDSDDDASDASERLNTPPPIHESLANDNPESAALERATRTVFLGNVSTDAIKSKSAKKTLLAHLSSFLPSLSLSTSSTSQKSTSNVHKIESIRFRSTAFASAAVPKRAAFAKKELMDATTRSTNAYVVYTSAAAARKALTLNGTVVLDRHLRVDSVAHPSVIDNKRCVFVGNLGFVDEQTPTPNPNTTDPKKETTSKPKKSSDIEEGLWRTFNDHCARSVESVRVIRDPTTRVGKGFAYVQFRDQNGVEAALLLDGKRFPPMLPRTLRVVRAKKVSSAKKGGSGNSAGHGSANRTRLGGGGRNAGNVDPNLKGRAAKLLGRAGAVQVRAGAASSGTTSTTGAGAGTTPFVFEGYRATEKKDGGSGLGFKLKNKGKGKGRGRPKTRSANRAKAYRDAKKGGGK